jgi:release factor glutamine methyltransferase
MKWMLTLREALAQATGQLSAHPDLRPTALADAAILLQHLLGVERATLIAHPERTLDRDRQTQYQLLLARRLRFEPIQYILGETEFYGLRLKVTPAVLIPRPETELLIEAVLARQPHGQPVRIADIGTGSGAIAVALAHALPQAELTALDLSRSALAVARWNAALHNVADRIAFLESDLLEAVAGTAPYDAIVSNPPYIPSSDAPTLHPQVRDYEPSLALFAGADGLEVYRRLISQAFARLKPSGLLALEIGYRQRDALAQLLSDFNSVEFLPDLQGIPRVALAVRP